MSLGTPLTGAEAAVFDTSVIPRYLANFGTAAVEMVIPYSPAAVADIGCRTGYVEPMIAEKLPEANIVGVDPSPEALTLARAKASELSGVHVSLELATGMPLPLPDASFTHGLLVHPVVSAQARYALLAELRRILVVGGQGLVALPVRGSFPEIYDMLREYALRQDLADFGKAVEVAAASRPTIESLSEELEKVGLGEVDVDVQLIGVAFNSGKEFLEDPIAQMIVFPDMRALLEADPGAVEAGFRYVSDAITKYWSEGAFELTVNIGCASGRRFE
ncbi:class I SAM-dependent methyltransferase [Polyangium mundeleinium]|uniref:Class I SAM-dependent methyltransferase n=1 Tax=Polyangium mundeleinium TaxID=2995306 RepID=A0ABT5F5S1_9BACT|nr:class I SAM-dependent methyltransferase [Polyangium mundeleinium]MDC0749449.1 class I SAM-dependent methyltransferase [Polyangium mundeleinium]